MGRIYKVENKTNGTVYIGQTIRAISTRWDDHIRAATTQFHKDYHLPLHNAIRLYGKDNFNITLVEECPNELLDEKEKYWIEYYDSYENGYNASLGGFGHQKYDYDIIVDYFLSHNNSIKDTCIYFKIYDQVVYTALTSKNIDYSKLKKSKTRTKHTNWILLVEKNLIFKRMRDIDKYFNKKTNGNIRRCLNGITEKAYGYHWKEIEPNDNLGDFGFTFFS